MLPVDGGVHSGVPCRSSGSFRLVGFIPACRPIYSGALSPGSFGLVGFIRASAGVRRDYSGS